MWIEWLFPVLSAAITGLATHYLLNSQAATRIRDIPNERSLHKTPVPRVGGLALMAGVLVAWWMLRDELVWWLIAPLLALFMISLLDDAHQLSVRWRLLSHLLAAGVLVIGAGMAQHGGLFCVILLLAIVWMTNLFNFMDGSDGLAGGMAFFGFSGYALAAMMGEEIGLAVLCFCVSAAALAFLFFNFHPARIFMGDGGSIPLGFLSAGMGVWGWQRGARKLKRTQR